MYTATEISPVVQMHQQYGEHLQVEPVEHVMTMRLSREHMEVMISIQMQDQVTTTVQYVITARQAVMRQPLYLIQ